MDSRFSISTEVSRLDFDFIYDFLSRSYWSLGIPRETLKKAIAGSICFGGYYDDRQVAFARVITDKATFAYLCDVFVAENNRGQGIGTRLMETIVAHPDLQGLRRFVLVTRDAHALYSKFGFTALAKPAGYMEVYRPGIYQEPPELA